MRWAEWAEIDRGGRRVDDPPRAHEGEARALGAAVRPRPGHPRCGAEAGGGESPIVFVNERGQSLGSERLTRLAQEAPDRGGAPWIPVELSGLGGRGDGPSARGCRGGLGSRRAEQGRGGLPANGPVRAAAAAHERLGGVSGGRALRDPGRCFERRSGRRFRGRPQSALGAPYVVRASPRNVEHCALARGCCAPLRTPSFLRRHRGSGRAGSAAPRTPSSVRFMARAVPASAPRAAGLCWARAGRSSSGRHGGRQARRRRIGQAGEPRGRSRCHRARAAGNGRLRARERDPLSASWPGRHAMTCRLPPGIHRPRKSCTPGPRGCEGVSRG